MARIETQEYPVTPTVRLVDSEGRATGDFFRLLKALANIAENVVIEDGEIKANMIDVVNLSAISAVLGDVFIGGTLTVGGYIVTGNVATNAISELTALLQVGGTGPSGGTIVSGVVPVTTASNTGLLLTLTSYMDRPAIAASNFGYWSMQLNRNGVQIDSTPQIFYDDNFSYQPVASFIDPTPGTNPTYSVTTQLHAGDGNFTITGGVLNVGLLKR